MHIVFNPVAHYRYLLNVVVRGLSVRLFGYPVCSCGG